LQDALKAIKHSIAWPLTKPIRLLAKASKRRRDRPTSEDKALPLKNKRYERPSIVTKIDDVLGRLRASTRKQPDSEFLFWIDFVYAHCLGRAPDPVGAKGWLGALRQGMPFSRFVQEVEASEEGQRLIASPSDGEFIVEIGELLFPEGRATPKEVELWKGRLKESPTKRNALLRHLINARFWWQRHKEEETSGTSHTSRIMGTESDLTASIWQARVAELKLTKRDGQRPRPALVERRFAHSGKYVVSAIASLYKGRRHLENFLDNITSQTIFDQSELIIVDADSPEGEEQIIAEYQKIYPNIIYKKINYRIGIYDAWNVAVRLARGRYLTNTNLDDLRSKNSFELQATALDRNSFADVVYQDFFYSLDPSFSFDEVAMLGFKSRLPLVTPNNLLVFNSPHNGPMWRKALHDELGLFDTSLKSAGDYEFWLRCLWKGKNFFKINTPHIAYYHNPEGVSTKPDSRVGEEIRWILQRYSGKLMPKFLIMSRRAFAEALGIAPEKSWDVSCYDIVQNQLKRLGDQYKSEPPCERTEPVA
jgi:glycosyltransferase involved in cell wall biosynthesis